MERVSVVRLDQDYWWAELGDAESSGLVCRPCVVEPGVGPLLLLIGRLWMGQSPVRRSRRKKWSARALPVAAPMPKSVSLFERKENSSGLVLACIFLRTFHRWGGCVFIMYIIPDFRVTGIISQLMRYFLPFIE